MTPEKDTTIQFKRLANETEYFTNVFKKIEKLVSVTFYILSHINETKLSETHISLIKDKAIKTHEASLAALRLQTHEAAEGLLSLQHALVSLESTLRIAEAAQVIPQNVSELLFGQILTIERYLGNNYLQVPELSFGDTPALPESKGVRQKEEKKTSREAGVSTPRRRHVAIPSNDISSDAYLVYSQLSDRSERIKTVLEAKPQATIRDIAEIITDVSEKTIQRELNSLIEKGQVMREGERRWSKYSVVK